MSMNKKEYGNVISAFKKAYLKKEDVQVSDKWQAGVIDIILRNTKNDFSINFFDCFQQFVWKLAPLTCAVALVLGIFFTQIDIFSDYELVKIFINDPSDLSLLSFYDV